MKSLLVLQICLVFVSLANAQTIPKSIDRKEIPVTPKTPKKILVKTKPVNIEPIKDSDGDGVEDKKDFCPFKKGDSWNGCPRAGPKPDLPEMLYIEGGSFNMGSNEGSDNKKPAHQVTVSSFYMSKYEITQSQWTAIMGNNPSKYATSFDFNHPVNQVSWFDTQEYLKKLNAKTGKNYRLPTEAEWEFAARGGNKSKGFIYSGGADIDAISWNQVNAPQSVGEKHPNELGLYDMSGNIREWCNDFYDETYYANSATRNPKGTSTGTMRVLRGGCWLESGPAHQVDARVGQGPLGNNGYIGFRIVVSE